MNVTMHQLAGDGEHDDSAAMQALFDGQPVRMPNGQVQQIATGQPVWLDAGPFLITRPLVVKL